MPMPHDITELKGVMASFATIMAPSKRRIILRKIAVELQKINKRRMTAETDPDGDKWSDRKSPPRKGKPKKMMMRMKKHLKTSVTSNTAQIGFSGRAGSIAKIHHLGLMASVSKEGPRVRYEMRQLIGIADGDLDALEAAVIEQLTVR